MGSLPRVTRKFSETVEGVRPLRNWLSSSQYAAFEAAGTNAHRIFSSTEGWIERFGDDLLLSYKAEAVRDTMLEGLPAWSAETGFPVQRIFGKFLPKQNDERSAPVLLSGDPALPLETVVKENGISFALDFAAGYSAGLFIDQRANRALVRRVGVKKLLNTFAYTCSFSVAAALGGAETVSIDLSKKSLDRGRENFALNNLSTDGHRFLADDVLDVLPRLARRGERFDCILLDPPTFSRGNKGRRWQVESDLEGLLTSALELAAPQARILLSTNCTRFTRRSLETVAKFALKLTRMNGSFHNEPEPPDVPFGSNSQTVWLNLR
jgi:23S rRNA (cytosine1962-C5)-methyltransferase